MTSSLNLVTCSLPDFAAAVLEAAASAGHTDAERFGARKVFIAAIAKALGVPQRGQAMDSFALRLITAQRTGLVRLARADLVAAMSREAVQASEIRAGVAEYHFVVDAAAKEPWETFQAIPVIEIRATGGDRVRDQVRQVIATLPDFVPTT